MRVRPVGVEDELEVAAWIPAPAVTWQSWTGTEPDPDVARMVLPKQDRSAVLVCWRVGIRGAAPAAGWGLDHRGCEAKPNDPQAMF